MEFYVCKHCGNLITFVENKGVPVTCCGEKMTKLVAGAVDAALEKHVPVVSVDGNKVSVSVGSVEHPMTKEHLISWIAVETSKGFQLKKLDETVKPYAEFALADGEEFVAAYEYCNLHGLWTGK